MKQYFNFGFYSGDLKADPFENRETFVEWNFRNSAFKRLGLQWYTIDVHEFVFAASLCLPFEILIKKSGFQIKFKMAAKKLGFQMVNTIWLLKSPDFKW